MARKLLTTTEAAALIGRSQRAVLKHLETGKLPGHRYGRIWLVYAEDLEKIRDLKSGNPQKVRGKKIPKILENSALET